MSLEYVVGIEHAESVGESVADRRNAKGGETMRSDAEWGRNGETGWGWIERAPM